MAASDPARLYQLLLNTGLQSKDNALHQVIHNLISHVISTNKQVSTIVSNSGGSTGATGPQGIQGVQGFPGLDGSDFSEPILITPASLQDIVSLFTQGSIIFAGPSGILAQDNAKFFWDDTNFRLQIPAIKFPLGTFLAEDALGVISVKAGLNQTNLFLYNTFTDSSNYEREFIGWSGNNFFITTNIAGTGVARNMTIGTNSLGNLDFITNSSPRWEIEAATGNIISFVDNTMDIGATGSGRPRSIYAGTFVITPIVQVDSVRGTAGTLDFYTSGVARWELSTGTWLAFADNTYDIGASGSNRPRVVYAGSFIVSPIIVGGTGVTSSLSIYPTSGAGTTGADTIFKVGNNGATEVMRILNSGLISFGGTSASFPAIKRTATSVGFRLADDSADAPISLAAYTHSGAEIDTTYQIYVPVTGGTVTMSAGQSRAIINPLAGLALLTVTLPPTPVNGQVTGFSFTQIITGLTVNAPGGATVVAPPTTAAVDSNFRFLYQASSTSWFPCS